MTLKHSFSYSGYLNSASSSPLLLRGAPDYIIDTVSELTHEQATVSEGLAQSPYVAPRMGLEPATFWTQGTESPHLINC